MNEMVITNEMMTLLPAVVIVLCFLILIVVLIKKGKKDIALRLVCAFIEVAEKLYGPGTGETKHNFVRNLIETMYIKLPPWITKYISLDDIDHYIVFAHAQWKKYIEDQLQTK